MTPQTCECKTCPCWQPPTTGLRGECRADPLVVLKLADEWCSRHPDFQVNATTKPKTKRG